jgi:TonB family protein
MASLHRSDRPHRQAGRPYQLADAPSLPVTGDGHPLRRGAPRRLVLSATLTLAAGLLALALWLMAGAHNGESASQPHRLPERAFRPGLRGPVAVVGELALRSGTDADTREGRPPIAGPAPQPGRRPAAGEAEAPPAAPGASADGLPEPVAAAGQQTGTGVAPTGPGGPVGAAGSPGAVEMIAPAQFSPCFVLKALVRPDYPADAPVAARRLATVTVEAAFFVDPQGVVSASYILRSEGGLAFEQAVLDAVNQWRFEPVTDPSCEKLGFWVRLPVVFRSPVARVRLPRR